MLNTEIDLDQIIKNLTNASLNEGQARAIAKEIHRATKEHPYRVVRIKLERMMSEVEAKLYKLRADLLKWNVGIATVQLLAIFWMLLGR